jgi:hypothetical protein
MIFTLLIAVLFPQVEGQRHERTVAGRRGPLTVIPAHILLPKKKTDFTQVLCDVSQAIRRPASRRDLALKPSATLVPPHQVGLRQDVPFHRAIQFGPARSGGQVRLLVQRIDPEKVPVRGAGWRTWASVACSAEPIPSLSRAIRQLPAFWQVFGQISRAWREIVQEPVNERAHWRIGILNHQAKTLRSRRRNAPLERGRNILTVASELLRNIVSRIQSRAFQRKPHGRSFPQSNAVQRGGFQVEIEKNNAACHDSDCRQSDDSKEQSFSRHSPSPFAAQVATVSAFLTVGL